MRLSGESLLREEIRKITDSFDLKHHDEFFTYGISIVSKKLLARSQEKSTSRVQMVRKIFFITLLQKKSACHHSLFCGNTQMIIFSMFQAIYFHAHGFNTMVSAKHILFLHFMKKRHKIVGIRILLYNLR